MNIPDREDLKPGAKLAGADFNGRHWGPLTLDRADLRGPDLSESVFSDWTSWALQDVEHIIILDAKKAAKALTQVWRTLRNQ